MTNSSLMKNITLLILFLSSLASEGQNVCINEVVSANGSIIMDSDGDYIELYNSSEDSVDLHYFKLSDNPLNTAKWILPEVQMPPDSYLLIFASGKDRHDPNELHTNFRIDQDGENLFLIDSEGEILSHLDPTYIPDDQSYSKVPDEDRFLISANPTPFGLNEFIGGVYGSHESGFYEGHLAFELNTINDEDSVFYTLDGDVPTVNDFLYSEALLFSNESFEPLRISTIPSTVMEGPLRLQDYLWKEPLDVPRCHVIRYAVFQNGNRVGKIHTKTFFIDEDFDPDQSFAIVSLVTDSLNFFDYTNGIYIPGVYHDLWGWSSWPAGNYHRRGVAWEREVHFSFFQDKNQPVVETDAGIRIRGHGSASFPQKSFNLYFKSEYGIKKSNYQFFPGSSVPAYKRLILRNSGNDFLQTHFKDALLHEVIQEMNVETQDFRPSIVYINGEYWGIYNLREKLDEFYFKYKYGMPAEQMAVVGVCGYNNLIQNLEYASLDQFVSQNDLSIESNYEYVASQMNISNFIDYNIAEIYLGNYDWPCNNMKMWKQDAIDEKWNFAIYDLDLAFGSSTPFDYESLNHATSTVNEWPTCECSSLLLRKLLMNAYFREQFINTFSYHLANTFQPDRIIALIDRFERRYEQEMPRQIARWRYPESMSKWREEINRLRAFANDRPCFMEAHLEDFFNLLDIPYSCSVEIDSKNTFEIFPNPSNGSFRVLNNSNDKIDSIELKVYSSRGELIDRFRIDRIYPGISAPIDLRTLPTGMYILTLKSQLFQQSLKISLVNE